MNKSFPLFLLLIFLLFILNFSLISAATLTGTIYNNQLEPEQNVLLTINTLPQQKYLAKEGIYSFELLPGNYTLNFQKGFFSSNEEIQIIDDTGKYNVDLFLVPDLHDEENLLSDTAEDLGSSLDENILAEKTSLKAWYTYWNFVILFFIIAWAGYRFFKLRKKYGSISKFRRQIKIESNKSLEQIKQEIAQEPTYLDRALEIIKQHNGRLNQKDLRQEMLPLSEAKISLIVSELEHQGKVDKIKKGRSNIIVLKPEISEKISSLPEHP